MPLIAMKDVRELVGGAAERLRSMRDGVASFSNEIETLEKERRRVTGREAVRIDRRLRELAAQRAAADELVVEAERQAGDASVRLTEATKEACANVASIGKEMIDAAGRFDRALADAMAALDQIEAAAAPAEGVLTHTTIKRQVNWPVINEAIAAAFKPRMNGLGFGIRHATMSEKVALIVSAMRENAAKLAKSNYRWGGNE